MGSLFVFLGPEWAGLGVGVVEQLSFSMFPSILSFDFDLILGSLLAFWGLMGYFEVGVGLKNCFGVSSYRLIIFVF